MARVINGLANFDGYLHEGRTVQDKLTSLGTGMVERDIEDSVRLLRATMCESQRFPELSRHVHEASRSRAVNAVSQLLNNATQRLSRTPKGPFGAERSIATAQIFMDLILLPMLMRPPMGHEVKAIRKDLPRFVRERVALFLAACKTDWTQASRRLPAAGPEMHRRAGRWRRYCSLR